jgi:hypothetical protein
MVIGGLTKAEQDAFNQQSTAFEAMEREFHEVRQPIECTH